MRRWPALPASGRSTRLLVLGITAWLGLGAPVAAQDPLPLRRVLLSTGGVAYFEHETTVEGDVELPLTVPLAQVDDVLKSIVVLDARGAAGTIRLPGREPLAQLFRDLPFGAGALASPVALLRALVGAEIRVAGTRALQGRLLAVTAEETALPSGLGRVVRHRVTVVVPGEGLRQILLEDAEQIELVDPTLRAEVTRALEAVSRHRVQDRRTLRIALRGEGRRPVRVGYVVEAPLWKATYRLTVPEVAGADAGAAPARGLLQGWAVVENMSGQDWHGVELTLAAGNPVTFRQALYPAYHVARPEVPVEVLGRVLPRPDTGALRAETRDAPAPAPLAPPSPAAAPGAAALRRAAPAAAGAPAEAPAPAPPATAVASDEAATQVLFRVADPISVASGQSAVIPIVHREVPVRRVALFDPGATTLHPLAAVDLTNDGDSGLPPGVLTLFERGAAGGAYVGDARLGALPQGEHRLLSFAVDQKVQVGRETEARELVARGTLARGVLELTVLEQQTTRYRLRGPAREGRRVVLEHPRVPDWRLVAPAERDVELTRDRYRIPLALEPAAEVTVTVTVERPRVTTIALAGLTAAALATYARTGALAAPVRQAFERLAHERESVEREERAVAALEARRREIHEEQQRLRANLGSVGPGDLRQRYLDKLRQQEDTLERIETDTGAARARLAAARQRLEATIAGLNL
jgi:hypothetical protein